MRRYLIIIPYAYGGNTGQSIQNEEKQLTTYMKNACTSCISAKQNAGVNVDVMLVSNIRIPNEYASLLAANGVIVEMCEFDSFNFGSQTSDGEKVNWQLAFYKLCALKHCVSKFDYLNYCFLDTDVYIQGLFDKIWEESAHKILLYDINAPVDGYLVKEIQNYLNSEMPLTHFGGEFFAASKDLSSLFVQQCENVFNEMIERKFVTKGGDEFITSIVANRLGKSIKNAGAYVRRYWTGSYRVVCGDYDKGNIVVLHVPAEKELGIIRLYNKYISKNIIPSKNAVYRYLHLRHRSMRVCIGTILRRLKIVK